MRASLALAALACAALCIATPARAGVASAQTSIVDSFLVYCPAGDMVFHVLARDAANNPEGDHEGDLEMCGCPGFRIATPIPSDHYTLVGCRVRIDNYPEYGSAFYSMRAGGTCAGPTIQVLWGGVLLRLPMAGTSPDQDGDLYVDAQDRALLVAKLAGAYDVTADLNGDDVLSPADLAVFEQHFGHASELPTAAPTATWGRLKTIYR